MGLRNRSLLTEEEFFFVTTTVKNFTNVFTTDRYCDILINNIKHYQKKYEFIILGYVIMPNHFHWIVKTAPNKGAISDIMRDIKKYVAWEILDLLEVESPKSSTKMVRGNSPKSIITQMSRDIPRQNITSEFRNNVKPGQKRQFWMHRFDDEVIRNHKMFWAKLKYIHNNPLKADMVSKPEDYKYSSAKNYIMNDNSTIFVDTTWGGID